MLNLEGRELGGCKLIRKLGAGGMGEVYLAEQRRLGNRLVAVKIVSPDDATFHPEVADDMARRFQREAVLLGQLSHPNILLVHDSGIEQNLLFLVMDYAPDGSLADAIRGVGKQKLTLPVALPVALDIVGQIAAALEYTHERGIVHRDVKPGNVLIRIERDGHWHMLLADFGVARDMEANSARSQISGTFAYMAPEQFSGQFSPASDQYALAVMTFQLLAGRTPFEGDLATLTRAHMYEQPPSIHALNPRLPAALDAVFARALAKDPAARYPSVAAFAAALREAANGDAGPTEQATQPAFLAPPPLPPEIANAATHAQPAAAAPIYAPPAQPPRRSGPGRLLLTGLAAVLLLIGAIGGTLLLKNGEGSGGGGTPTQTVSSATATPTVTLTATVGVTPVPTLATCPPGLLQPPVGGNMTCLPKPPVPVGSALLADVSPSCDSSAAGWLKETFASTSCGDGGVTITSTAPAATANDLACLDGRSLSATDGFLQVLVARGTGGVALGFRERLGDSSGGGNNYIEGYYIVLTPAASQSSITQYELVRLDAAGHSHSVGSIGTFSSPLAAHFALGLQFQGGQFTLFVNGNRVDTFNDSALGSAGWVGLCALNGGSTFKDAELFQPGS